VLNALLSNFIVSADRIGMLFENLVFTQLYHTLLAAGRDFRLSHYRTAAGAEVDIVLELDGEIFALEVKGGYYKKTELHGLESLQKYTGKKIRKFVLVPRGRSSMAGDINIIDWQSFLAGYCTPGGRPLRNSRHGF